VAESTRPTERQCVGCDTRFEVGPRERNPRKWCSTACRQWQTRNPGQQRPTARLHCEVCGQELSGQQRRFCTKEHADIGYGNRRAEPLPDKQCIVCGKSFTPRVEAQVCCPPTDEERSRCVQARSKCARRKMNADSRGVSFKRGEVTPPFDCERCGKRSVPGQGETGRHATRFCSEVCKKRWHSEGNNRAERRERRRERVRQRMDTPEEIGTPRHWVAGCCASPNCTTTFVGHGRYCSKRCKTRESKRRHGRRSDRSRARRHGALYEPINRYKVFERDGWVCQICGEDTDRDAVPRGPIQTPLAPTIDHIIPMGRGGDHLYSNVQCACFECNWIKGDDASLDPSFVD